MLFGFLRRQDWFLNGALAVLALASLTVMKSAGGGQFSQQLIWFVIGFVIVFASAAFDWRIIVNYRWMLFLFYGIVVVLLASTLIFAPEIRNVRGWLVLGEFRFQPSELAKVSLIILLSYFFAKRHVRIAHAATLMVSLVYAAIPAAIVFLQPDWGSALVLLGVWVSYLLVSGIKWRHLLIGCVIIAVLFFISWNFMLQDYQKERVIGFLEPAYDPLGVNWGVIQAKIAIGSAGILGKGFGQGTQLQLGFLPEPTTDFIFAALTEEWGLAGAFIVVGAFLVLATRAVRIGLMATNAFSQFVSLGTAALFLIEFFLNVGSNIGFVPVIGVTFPFLSYGGSSLLTKSILVGIMQSIASRSKF